MPSDVLQLWREYEHKCSEEAVLLCEPDKMKMAQQADRNEEEHATELNGFFESTDRHVRNSGIARDWLDIILYQRENRKKNNYQHGKQ